jgi:hypothetical protein
VRDIARGGARRTASTRSAARAAADCRTGPAAGNQSSRAGGRAPSREAGDLNTQKPADTKPAEAPAPVEQPPAPPQNTGTQIRTPATADTATAEKLVRESLSRARERLKNIDYRRLSGGAQKAYNEAKDFIERSEAALKASNFELAKELAGKAEKLANELQGR